MLNKQPIFINGFQRGGTNIMMNLILSHPHVCKLSHSETHRIFYGREDQPVGRWFRRALYAPLVLSTQQHVFWHDRFYERKMLPKPLHVYLDWLFYRNKLDEQPSNGHETRFLTKNVNGVTLASSVLADVYPDAYFLGLVRNGLAVCEGFARRGWTAERFGKMYKRVCEQMIVDEQHLPNYSITRFEDILADPATAVPQLYKLANLDISLVNQFRMQAKKSMNEKGEREYTLGADTDRQTHLFPLHELSNYLRKDVNDNQIARLKPEDKEIFLHYGQAIMEHFGYL